MTFATKITPLRGGLLNPNWQYTRWYNTDIRKTFAAARNTQQSVPRILAWKGGVQ